MTHADTGAGIQSLDAIRSAAESFVRAQLPADARATVTAGSLDSRLRLTPCAGALRASIPSGATLQTSRVTVGVRCSEGAGWTVYVPVSITSEIPVLVLRHAVTRGARVTAEDVIVQTRRVSGCAAPYLTKVEDLQGRTLKRPLPAGAALTADVFVVDFLVRRGEQVTLLASGGGIEVRAPGRALADGRAGAYLKAQNLSSLAVVEGVVAGPGVIRVAP